MQTNELPAYDASDNPTGCCPRFNPAGWDGQDLHFDDKLFVRAVSRSKDYVPIDLGPVFESTFDAIQKAGAYDEDDIIIMSRDLSPSETEHLISVRHPVPDLQDVRLNGNFLTKVLEGPYENAPLWEKDVRAAVKEHGDAVQDIYYFYTTCPKCAQVYGKNYVVAVAQLS